MAVLLDHLPRLILILLPAVAVEWVAVEITLAVRLAVPAVVKTQTLQELLLVTLAVIRQ
jgi:hypothetical protein